MMKKILFLILIVSFSIANSCNNRLFSLSTEGDNSINLKTLITDLSDTCNLNIIVTDDIAKSKLNSNLHYLKLKNVTLDEFLNHILSENGFFYTLKNNTLTISYIKTKTFKIDYINSVFTGETTFAATTPQNNSGTGSASNTLNSTFNFDFWTDFTKNIQNLLLAQSSTAFTNPPPVIDKNSGLVTITGTKSQLDRIAKYIKDVNERLHKQVFIDVKIYSVKLSNTNRTGVDWSNFALKMDTGTASTAGAIGTTILNANTFTLTGLLNFLSQYGEVDSISNPKITTLNNQKAIITVGQTKNYSYKTVTKDANGNSLESDTLGSKFIGILVDITPEISDKGIISLSINPSISSIDPTQLNPNLPPDTFEKKLTTMVRVKDNETIILGGLITDEKSFTANGVNFLHKIPIIKYLFSSKTGLSSREELVFVITPHIINLNKHITIKDAGYKKTLPQIGDF